MMTLVASALAGGDCIDDADVLRTGGTACTLGGTVKAPSTLGTFLRSFRWGHVRQLDRVSRELLARAWQAGAGPGDGPLTIDLDSTICETYGLAKEGARHHGLYRQAGLPPAAGHRRRHRRRADVPGCARAGPTPPAAPPTSCGRRWDGCATPGPTDDSRYGPTAGSTLMAWYPSAARWMSASPSPSASTKACTISSRRYPKMPGRRFLTGWTVPPMWPRPPAPPSRPRRTPAPVRLIVRRVKPTPGSQLALFAKIQLSWLHHRPGRGGCSNWRLTIAATPRSRNAIRDLKYGVGLNHLPSGRFAANGAWLAVQTMAHNLARWTARIGLGERIATTKTLRRRFLLPGRTAHPLGTPVDPASSGSLALG